MRAVAYKSFGAAKDVLEMVELPTPTPGPGEVLVKLAYSGVNPSDVKARAGARPGVTKPPFDMIIPHSDGSGWVAAMGDGVDTVVKDQPVWVRNGQWQRAFGTAAEYIVLAADQVFPLPDDVPLESGAVLGIPGLTAAHTVFNGGEIAGKRVLVHGAAGTVGYLAAQLAIWGGAEVVATARGPGLDRLRALGLTTVDFSAPNLSQALLKATDGAMFDRIVDPEFGVNAATNAEVIAVNGRVNAYGSALEMSPTLPFYPMLFKAVTLEMALVYHLTPAQCADAAQKLLDALQQDRLHIPIDHAVPLSETAAAHDRVASGARNGAVLVEIGAPN